MISESKISTPLIDRSPWAGGCWVRKLRTYHSISIGKRVGCDFTEADWRYLPHFLQMQDPCFLGDANWLVIKSFKQKPLKVVAVLEKPEPDVLSSSTVIAAPVEFERTSLPSSLTLAVTTPPVSALIFSTSSSIELEADMVKVVAVPTPCSVTVMTMPDWGMVSLVTVRAAPKALLMSLAETPNVMVDLP